MGVLKKLFGGMNMSWPKVVILAVVSGVVTGLIMMCPPLEKTSIHNIGVTMEMWILLAMIVALNSQKWWEAGLKVFVFFLISQPLVYLTMWPVYQSFPWHYYMYWFYWTVAAAPMGCLAWRIKKGDLLGMLILAVPCTFLAMFGSGCLSQAIHSFPNQLLAALFCYAQVVAYVLVLADAKKKRVALLAVSLVVAVVVFGWEIVRGPGSSLTYGLDDADQYTYALEDDGIVKLTETNDSSFTLEAKGYGSTVLTITKPDGSTVVFDVTVNRENGGIYLTER